MSWGRCSCGQKRGECPHANPHIRAVDGNGAERKQREHRDAKAALTTQVSRRTAGEVKRGRR